MTNRDVPPEVNDNLRRWGWIGNTLRILQILLAIIGTVAALVVATFTAELGVLNTKIASFISAFCLGILGGFNIGGKADSMRRAWRHLTSASVKYREDATYPIDDLMKAYDDAEAMIGDVPFHEMNHLVSDHPQKQEIDCSGVFSKPLPTTRCSRF